MRHPRIHKNFADLFKPVTLIKPSHLRLRGDYKALGVEVEPDTPAVLPPLKRAGAEANRLDLARWLRGDYRMATDDVPTDAETPLDTPRRVS